MSAVVVFRSGGGGVSGRWKFATLPLDFADCTFKPTVQEILKMLETRQITYITLCKELCR